MRKNQDLGNYHDHRDHIDVGDADYDNLETWSGRMPSTRNLSWILDDVERLIELCKIEQWHCMSSSDSPVTLDINELDPFFAFLGIRIFPISKHSQLFFSWDCVKRHLTIKILRIQFYENRTTILPLSSWLVPLWQKDQPLAQHQSDNDTYCGESLLDFCFIWRGCKR